MVNFCIRIGGKNPAANICLLILPLPAQSNSGQMNKILVFTLAVLTLFIVSCSGGKSLTSTIQKAETAYQMGEYENSLKIYEEVIARYIAENKANECPVYTEAAAAAVQVGDNAKATEYLEKETYTTFVTASTYFELAEMYRGIDNLSKEMDALETYAKKYPHGQQIEEVQLRLYEIYFESNQYEKAMAKWDLLSPDAQNNEALLESYFVINKKMDNDSVCNTIAGELLQINENNIVGLEWEGEKYFWKAEKRYAEELKAYDANKTNKQYNILLKALDEVSADFKTSLGYFTKLFTIDPQKKYAKYLGDIYNRLDDKSKAKYYYNMIDGWE